MSANGTLLLDRRDVCGLLGAAEYVEIVENAFRAHATGRSLQNGLLHVEADAGEFHIKAGGLTTDRPWFGLKVNGGFFANGVRFGMPHIQGIILLCDAENGYPMALMDSTQITLSRTGATTAVAARYLARPDSRIATICGCGNQGRVQLTYLTQVCGIDHVFAYDTDPAAAESFAADMGHQLGIDVVAVTELGHAVQQSDICITCTPSREPFMRLEYVPPGMFLAAVGADSPDKQELDTQLLATSTVVVDLLEQCMNVGELHHALADKIVSIDDVHAEMSAIVNGDKPGRTSRDEIIIFDATGTALQDTAAAAAIYSRAIAQQRGRYFNFFAAA